MLRVSKKNIEIKRCRNHLHWWYTWNHISQNASIYSTNSWWWRRTRYTNSTFNIWKKSFITDCDDAQQNAIHSVYPSVKILLCQWHVKHAWQKNKSKIKAESGNYKPQEKNIKNSNLGLTKKQVIQKAVLDELGVIMRLQDASQVGI